MNKYTELARKTAETYAKTGKTIPVPEDLSEEFYRAQKGVFVTIYKSEGSKRNLRGCVGTFEPTKSNIAEEIIQNAVWASQEDNRFSPIQSDELDSLSYEVSLLEPPEQIYSTADLDSQKYGIIIKTVDGRTGLLLPDIEGVDSPAHQIEIAARKGDIDIEHEEFSLFRFTVTKFKE
ncbi:MAG: AmmeMemoRadiSam system protein A [Candidatus Pacebacteria bacterium]|nr:AmmeMemoRadiSam system protein A [Candidatus Paceibacterota bacterium]